MDKLNIKDLINPKNELEDNRSSDDIIKLATIENLFNKDNLKTNSRIKMTQVSRLSKLILFSDIFEVPFVNDLANNILELQISISGLGRKELVDIVGKVNNELQLQDIQPIKKGVFR